MAILDSAGIPVVGGVDALLIWVSVTSPGTAYLAAATAVIGSLIGSLVLFFLARKGGEAYLARYTSSRRGAKLKSWFLEYGLLTVFVPSVSFVPMPLKVFVISAGALGVNPLLFALVLTVARVIRYFFLAWLGLRLGDQALPYLKQHIWMFVALAIGLFASLYFLIAYLDKRRR